MAFAEPQIWFEQLVAGDKEALAETSSDAGFAEPAKTATNLALLQEIFANPELVMDLARMALQTADPDQALNNLEVRLLREWAASLEVDAKSIQPRLRAYLQEGNTDSKKAA